MLQIRRARTGNHKPRKSDFLTHNKVRLVQGGHAYFELLEEMIDGATESIHLQTYIFDEDATGTMVADALIRAAQRNVKVYMLVDGYGSQQLSEPFIKRLTDAGIFFRKFLPMFKSRRFYLGRRLHHKVVVVDSLRCTVSGLNISDRYNDTPEAPAWLDWALYAEGEVAAALEAICKSRLRLRRNKVMILNKVYEADEECLVGVRVNDWLRRKRQIYKTYLRLFRDSSSYMIIMSAYFLPGRAFRKKIEQAAARGVKVKVIVTGNADIYLIKYAERYIYQWMFRHGIEVYEYTKNVLHGKIAVCDGQWMTVGSFNVNNLSAYASIELNLEVNNPEFARHVQQRLEHIIAHDCVRITEENFKKQGNLLVRAARRAAYDIFRFLFFLSTRQAG